MAQSIRNLALGSKIRDNKGNIFRVVAFNHYGSNQVTLMHTNLNMSMQMNKIVYNAHYGSSEVHYYLNNGYLDRLQTEIKDSLLDTTVYYNDAISGTQSTMKSIITKAFIPANAELVGDPYYDPTNVSGLQYFYTNSFIRSLEYSHSSVWTRTEVVELSGTSYVPFHYVFTNDGDYTYSIIESTLSAYVVPFINLPSDILVSNNVEYGAYSFIFNEPPVIQTINSIQGNYGSATNISYVATDSDDATLNHYISFNNGTKWQQIFPSRSGNIYTYSHVFSELNTFYCRIKVVDSAKNETVSNAFTITVNAVAPTVNIVSVVDKVVTFKTNCITSEVSKVEIIINNKVVKTFENGFNFNLVYEIDRNSLSIGKNSIQIKATSKENLIGYANLEASKTKYNLPQVGAKIIVNGFEYTILNSVENGSNQTYTLSSNLINTINKGDIVKVTQDSVKVLCSMSNLEDVKDYKEMKLVKTKKLKGDFEGYVEEKYELQGEGRYSTVKLEVQRFNNNVATEILELQQYFDYLED